MPTITGKSSSETLRGTDEADRIIPNGGEDIIYGGGGNDEINGYLADPIDQRGGWSYYFQYESLIAYGGDGNDVIIGGSEADKLFGEDGDDVLVGYEGDDELKGGSGNDTLRGREGNDDIDGGDGDDYIRTGSGNDVARGGEGDDLINASSGGFASGVSGNKTIYGDAGDDKIGGGSGDDTIYGGVGDDNIWARDGQNKIFGEDGDDELDGGDGDDIIEGGSGDDELFGYGGNDTLTGGLGNDYLSGGDGDDLLNGGLGDDEIRTGSGNDIARGGEGDDFINADDNGFSLGLSGNKSIFGDAGDDKIGGGDSDDTIYGGLGNDHIWAMDGQNKIYGEDGDDRLYGGHGDDIIEGGNGDDELYGYEGNNTLIGGEGNDYLAGGNGDDTYYINSLTDHIYDTGGNDTAIVSVSFAKIPVEIETVTYTNGALPLPYWIDSLVASDGNGGRYASYLSENREFYYTFPNTIPDYDTREDHAVGYTGLNATQQRNAASLIKSLSTIIGVSISSTTSADQQNTIAIALNNQVGSGGFAQYPNSRSTGSDIFLNNEAYNSTLSSGTFGAYTITHELGHALGLKHPFDEEGTNGDVPDPPYLQGTEDHARWTMMSYNQTGAENKLAFSELDIAALQYIYGPSKTERTGDDTYYIDSDTPNFIWDGDGTDTIDASSLGERITLHLSPGYHDFIGESANELITASGQITINFGSVIENLKGSSFADDLHGNEIDNEIQGNAGNDTIFGGKGDDKLDYSGAYGDDTLYGGPGDDEYYVYAYSGDDKFIEYEDEGVDSIYTNISYSLDNAPYVENLYSFSNIDSNLDLTGNTLDNRLASSKGNCTIDGSLGTDTVWYGWDYSFEECYVFYRDDVLNVEKGNGSIDKLFNVEFLAFSDTTVAVDKNFFDNLDTNIAISSVKYTYNEGESATFILSTEGIEQGTKVAYTISGISEEDIDDDALTGQFIVGEDGRSEVNVLLTSDKKTEGGETLTLTLDDYQDSGISIGINDTSIAPELNIVTAKPTYNEGESATFILSTEGIEQGTKVAYTISGISEEDIDDDALTGQFIVGENGQSIVTISLAQDELTEGDEFLTLVLNEYEDQRITIEVKDTSVDPVFSTENYRTSILVDANIISEDPVLIHDLTEEISKKNGEVINHFFAYGESQYSYDDIDSSIMVILRNEDFSEEFKEEIIDYAPTAAALNYSDLVKLVGLNTIDSTLMKIAGADGEYVS